MELFEVQDLTYFYPEADMPALEDIDLKVKKGVFVLITGPSGSGKSTLARAMAALIPDFYGGRVSGHIFYDGEDLKTMDKRRIRKKIGIVFQNPERQIVMNEVEKEISFGLENLGEKEERIKRGILEVSSFLGLSGLMRKRCRDLSGGQKQKVIISSVLAMGPDVLILDEPTSQLDPVATEEVFHMIDRLKREMGYTIIVVEQKLERCLGLADRVVYLDRAKIVLDSTPGEFLRWASDRERSTIPMVSRLFAMKGIPGFPLTIQEAKKILAGCVINKIDRPPHEKSDNAELVLNKASFRYPDGTQAVKGLSLKLPKGKVTCVLGENGAGKSTLLKLLAGLYKPTDGSVKYNGNEISKIPLNRRPRLVGYLSQNPDDYLFNDSVEEEILFTMNNVGIKDKNYVDTVLSGLDIGRYAKINPRQLSTGQRQRAALAAVLAARPYILLVDEPTRGLDYKTKDRVGAIIRDMTDREGKTVVLVTQDLEFAAEYADLVALLFKGEVITFSTKEDVFENSIFYAPSINKLFSGLDNRVVTLKDAMEALDHNG